MTTAAATIMLHKGFAKYGCASLFECVTVENHRFPVATDFHNAKIRHSVFSFLVCAVRAIAAVLFFPLLLFSLDYISSIVLRPSFSIKQILSSAYIGSVSSAPKKCGKSIVEIFLIRLPH